jgi:hypothetical protein
MNFILPQSYQQLEYCLLQNELEHQHGPTAVHTTASGGEDTENHFTNISTVTL